MKNRSKRDEEILVEAAWMIRAHQRGVVVADALTFKASELRALEAVVADGGPEAARTKEAIDFRRAVAKRVCSALDLTPESLVELAKESANGEDVLL